MMRVSPARQVIRDWRVPPEEPAPSLVEEGVTNQEGWER